MPVIDAKPDFRLNQQIVGLSLGKGSALAKAGDRATNQARIIAPQPRDRKAELADRARFEILHEYVGALEHGFEQRLVLGFAEIEHHQFLAAVEPDEIAALAVREAVIVAAEIALGPLDLDDACARVGEPAGAHRRRDRLFKRYDQKTGERQRHLNTPSQYDRGKPSTCSAMYESTRLVEIGATV